MNESDLSPSKGKRGSFDLGLEERPDFPKRQKMLDLESVILRSEGTKTCNLEFQKKKENIPFLNPCAKEGSSNVSLEPPLLTLGQTYNNENLPDIPANLTKPHEPKSGALTLDLNAKIDEQNPFYPYKNLDQFNKRPTDLSECGSTTGPITEERESGSLKLWREMKQNGFLSKSHSSVALPRPRGRPKKKIEEVNIKINKKKTGITQKEVQANQFTKVAAPSGLLSGLNPGIINHVRNSKQVYSIIEAIVRSEKEDGDQFNLSDLERKRECSDTITGTHLSGYSMFCEGKMPAGTHSGNLCDESLKLKLSSDEFGSKQTSASSLSLKAATVASQWLDLLQQDIRGRLAALRRSKKRVRNVIQTELPYILSTTEVQCNNGGSENIDPSVAQNCSDKVGPHDSHIARWNFLFGQMDKALHEEGLHLENWLRQVQEMQISCDKGLKYTSSESFIFNSMGNLSKMRKLEDSEHEQAVNAAAASIYSTCNFIMRKENVSCF